MIKYHFDGVNVEGKKVGGFLFASDDLDAREKLKKNGYAVLTLTPYVEESMGDPHLTMFEFRGQNAEEAFVQGKIEANDEYEAYKKLRLYYNLRLLYIVPKGLSPLETQKKKDAGISPEVIEKFEEEFKKQLAADKKSKKLEPNESEKVAMLTEKSQKKMDFYRKSIEKVIEDVSQILVGLEGRISYEEYRDLKEQLDNLARLRSSNSIDHLDHLVRRLFDKLRSIQAIDSIDGHTKQLLEAAVGGISEKFDQGVKTSMDIDLSFIDTKEVKKTIRSLNLIDNILRTLYGMFVVLAFFCVAAYIILLLKGFFVGFDNLLFMASSNLFLFVTSFSLLFVLFYFPPLFRSEGWDRRQKILYGIMTSIAWGIYIIEFPVLFFWT